MSPSQKRSNSLITDLDAPPSIVSKPRRYHLTIPSARRFLGDVRQFVEAHARNAGLPSDDIEHLKLATDEACTNIMLHAYRGKTDQTIEVIVTVSTKQITVTLRDHGQTFDWQTYKRPNDLRDSINARRGGGWGIYMMQKLMDKVEYSRTDSSNEVHLIKQLRSAPA